MDLDPRKPNDPERPNPGDPGFEVPAPERRPLDPIRDPRIPPVEVPPRGA